MRNWSDWFRSEHSRPELRLLSVPFVAFIGCLVAPIVHANDAVTPVNFAVSESGVATLSIPIKVPRGIGGLEPELQLSYSSGAGNGLVGLGWTLLGPSAITRCGRSELFDGVNSSVKFNKDDRFCLDGQRLLRIEPTNPNGTIGQDSESYGNVTTGPKEYRTARDSFSRIRTAGGVFGSGQTYTSPKGFVVETKSGLIMEYGNTLEDNVNTSAMVLTANATGVAMPPTVLRWSLHRIRDRNGNSMEFFYCSGLIRKTSGGTGCESTSYQGSTPIHYIRYTGRVNAQSGARVSDGTFAVVFRYDLRPDIRTTFLQGTVSKQSQRLAAIETYRDFGGPDSIGSMIRRYQLSYMSLSANGASQRATTTSMVESVQEMTLAGERLPAIRFAYPIDKVFGVTVSHDGGSPIMPPPKPNNPFNCGGISYIICP